MIYTEEDILLNGALFEDEDQTIPLTLEDKQLSIIFIKTADNSTAFTITDDMIEKQDNTFAYIMNREHTIDLAGMYKLQVNIVQNNSVVKSFANKTITINKSKNVP